MEQQLRNQVQKNKTLLNANMTLMQQNQLYMNSLNQLKKFMTEYKLIQNIDDDSSSSICADQAEGFVMQVMEKIKEIKQHGYADNSSLVDKTELKGKANDGMGKRDCECEKWKNMYMNQSQESLRLSKKLVEAQQSISRIQAQHQIQYKEMDNILKQYLALFQRVNSTQFLQTQASSQKKIKQPTKQNFRSNTSKQRRSTSKPKNTIKSVSSNKKPSKTNIQIDKTISTTQIIPAAVTNQVTDFPNFVTYLQNLRNDYGNAMIESKMLREQLCDAEILIKAYREKERERILYGKFVLQ